MSLQVLQKIAASNTLIMGCTTTGGSSLTIVINSKVRDDCFVQLKGHRKPDYIENGQYISEAIKVTTLNFLLNKPMPSMLCVCDIENDEKLFFVWINEDIQRIEKETPDWKKQKTISIRIPVKNVIEKDPMIHQGIEGYVTKFHNILRNNKEIINVLGPSLGIDEEILTLPKDAVFQIARPVLEKAGLIDDVSEDIKTYSPSDQDLLGKIKEASILLNKFQDDIAIQQLDELADCITDAPNSLKAKYLNNYGVYYSHQRDLANALKFYKEAFELSPKNHKIANNYLLVKFVTSSNEGEFKTEDQKKWIVSLEAVLREHPDFVPIISTKTYFLGQSLGAKKAEEFISNTDVWKADPLESRICLAELYLREGNSNKAKELLQGLEDKNSFLLYSLLGFINLTLSTGINHRDKEPYITGAGPSSINYSLLREAERNYKKSYDILLRIGLPRFAEEIIVNYSTVLHLLFKHEEGLRICLSLSERYPKDFVLQGSIGSCYLGLGLPEKAISYAKKAFEMEPNTTTLKNLCICLLEAEEHDSLVSVISEHIEDGLIEGEKGLFLSLLAISYNEIGREAKSKEIINTMRADDFLAAEAVSVEATICRKNGHSREEAIEYFRKGKEKHPGSMILLTNYTAVLKPSDKKEAKIIVECFKELLNLRELSPEEYISFSRAYLTLGDADKSVAVISRAHEHFPENIKIIYELAVSLSTAGDEEQAYKFLKTYLARSSADYRQIKNLAILAFDTGRIEEAISLLHKALSKTTDLRERGEIHCHLFELKRMTGQPQKELIKHIHEYGKTVGEDDILEARYLSMILLATTGSLEVDDETRAWLEIARERLRVFSERNPQNPFFKMINNDLTVPERERGKEILSAIMAETLPYTLRRDKLSILIRNATLPLTFRSAYLGGHSIFEYWSSCTKSNLPEEQLHIWNPSNNLEKEFEIAKKTKQICIDISALLTLTGLDLLDVLQEFDLIILARGTKNLIAKELADMTSTNVIAKKLEEWRLQNKYKIRIRNSGTDTEDDELHESDIYEITEGGLFIRQNVSLKKTIGGGMGESILISHQMKIALYSDDSVIRYLAFNEYGCEAFSTVSLLDTLVEKGNMKIEGASEVLSRLIQNNYVIVPFEVRHLQGTLLKLLRPDKMPKRDDLMADNIMGTLLRQFGDPSLDYTLLVGIAIDWWISILSDYEINSEVLVECMEPVSYALSMHSVGGVIMGMVKEEREMRLTSIWMSLIMKLLKNRSELVPNAWSAIKTVCERLYGTEHVKFTKIIYNDIPKKLINFLEGRNELNKGEKIELILKFTEHLPPSDKERIEVFINKARPSFF